MEGRAIARPNDAAHDHPPPRHQAFNGGPGNCPAEPASWCSSRASDRFLQWRAGQLPGRTRHVGEVVAAVGHPSMEGRAIARPNGATHRPMVVGVNPSMEGRAIARPNSRAPQWASASLAVLQWRAGQLPGRTRREHRRRQHHILPSMEGRAIARPNPSPTSPAAPCESILQWRAGQLPGRTPAGLNATGESDMDLQWRAGQLPGRTPNRMQRRAQEPKPSMEGRAIARPNWRPSSAPGLPLAPFNGGPGNCPAEPDNRRGGGPPRHGPSMEGRAIARPN